MASNIAEATAVAIQQDLRKILQTERRHGVCPLRKSWPGSMPPIVMAILMGSVRGDRTSARKGVDSQTDPALPGANDRRWRRAQMAVSQTVLRKSVSLVAAVILSVLSSAASSAARRSIAAS
jgi:hypothetical protein